MILDSPELIDHSQGVALTYCEAYTLRRRDLETVLEDFPEAKERVRKAMRKMTLQRAMLKCALPAAAASSSSSSPPSLPPPLRSSYPSPSSLSLSRRYMSMMFGKKGGPTSFVPKSTARGYATVPDIQTMDNKIEDLRKGNDKLGSMVGNVKALLLDSPRLSLGYGSPVALQPPPSPPFFGTASTSARGGGAQLEGKSSPGASAEPWRFAGAEAGGDASGEPRWLSQAEGALSRSSATSTTDLQKADGQMLASPPLAVRTAATQPPTTPAPPPPSQPPPPPQAVSRLLECFSPRPEYNPPDYHRHEYAATTTPSNVTLDGLPGSRIAGLSTDCLELLQQQSSRLDAQGERMERMERSVGQIGDMVKALLAAQGRPMHEQQRQKWEAARQTQGTPPASRQPPPQRQASQEKTRGEVQGEAQGEAHGEDEAQGGDQGSRELGAVERTRAQRENSVQSFRELRKSVRALQLNEAASRAMFSKS